MAGKLKQARDNSGIMTREPETEGPAAFTERAHSDSVFVRKHAAMEARAAVKPVETGARTAEAALWQTLHRGDALTTLRDYAPLRDVRARLAALEAERQTLLESNTADSYTNRQARLADARERHQDLSARALIGEASDEEVDAAFSELLQAERGAEHAYAPILANQRAQRMLRARETELVKHAAQLMREQIETADYTPAVTELAELLPSLIEANGRIRELWYKSGLQLPAGELCRVDSKPVTLPDLFLTGLEELQANVEKYLRTAKSGTGRRG